jgi:acetyl-CoA/propionyl-CoA carboxylase, biotin carboxylase, biotin carboxyl carrier protein
MLESVLIANRGEIAARIVRACRDLGVRSIAVYSDADSGAEHVQLADEAVYLGASEVRESYLSIDKIIAAAQQSGAAAIHPGYGLLSENGEFADRVVAAGIIFIGPTAEVIELLGDKRTAREQAEAVGLAVLPARMLADEDDPIAVAEQIGYPLLVKAAFGGGGRGMRIVNDPAELVEAIAGAQRENQTAFGRADVYLERFLPKARHVEVQIISDTLGNVRHLGTRDCSTQRRNQKLIEEAPAFELDPDVAARALAGSQKLAQKVGYHGAATVEFLVGTGDTGGGELYFLEVNTRLQVEHTVTEVVTGIDIVATQLAIASGEPIPFGQDDVRLTGHAIEARINAEDPAGGFFPHAGQIGALRYPSGPWVRVDPGIVGGSTVSQFYDSLLAKITAWGPDRDTARKRLLRALKETKVEGIPTTTAFLSRVLEDDHFRNGTHWTAMVDSGAIPTTGLPAPLAAPAAPASSAATPRRSRGARIRTPEGEIRLDVPVQDGGARLATRATTDDGEVGVGAGVGSGPDGGVAPMDAVLVRHTVEVGQEVEANTTVAVVESMKMETHVISGTKGLVVAIHANAGDSLKRGERLVTVEPAAE